MTQPISNLRFEYMNTSERRVVNLEPLGLRAVPMLGYCHYRNPRPDVPEHWHQGCIEIHLGVRNTLTFGVGNRLYRLGPGDIFVNLPDEKHTVSPHPKGLIMHWIVVRLDTAPAPFLGQAEPEGEALRQALRHIPHRLFRGNLTVKRLFKSLHMLVDDEATPLRTLRLRITTIELLMEVLFSARAHTVPPEEGRLEVIRHEMLNHPEGAFYVADLARRAGMAPNHFITRFRDVAGLPPRQFLLDCRMRRASRLLRESAMPVTEIALSLGFCSSQHFANLFKRHTGVTPLAWRAGTSGPSRATDCEDGQSAPGCFRAKKRMRKVVRAAGLLAVACALAAAPVGAGDAKFLELEAPITRWVDAIPLGNGQAGALIWGEGDEIRFTLDRADYWHQRRNPMFGDPRFKWRNLVNFTNDYEKLKSVFIVRDDPTKLPGARLVAKLAGGARCRRFTLDIRDGSSEIVLDTPAGERVLRAWFDDDSPYLSLAVPSGVTFASLAFTTNSAFAKLGGYPEPRAEISGKGAFYRRGNRIGAKGRWVRDFAAGVSFLPAEARPDSAFWQRFWSVSEVRIPEPKLQHFYDFAMYCYGAASRPPHAPIALQAVWTADNGGLPPWHGDYHMDMNVQETYWAAPVAGQLDALDAFADHMAALLPELQQYGRDFFDMKNGGAAIPGHMAYDGSFIAGGAMWALPLVHGLWAFAQVYDAWAYRPTPERLAKIWPLAAALAEGTDQVLLPPDAGGVRRYAVSATPEIGENTAEAVSFTPNTTYDRSITRGFFKQVANLAAAKGDNAARDRFLKIASSLGKPNLDARGLYLLDAKTPLKVSHRHPSHLHDVFPYFDVEPGAEARAAYAAYVALGRGKWAGHTFVECACKAAALGDGEEALFCLNEFADHYVSRNGFYINYYYEIAVRPDRTPSDIFTLEGNLALARGVQEMLLAGRADAIAVFPALPKAWNGKEISFRDLLVPGGHRVSAKRAADGTITGSATGFSAVKTKIILPGGQSREVTLRPGHATPFEGR
ncbi:MAG: helix-turn-helix domain-containing protein [Kiritimatiellae bacterium]|nr:helix-turn-helix domain-containing protein [Kiritimatiellia bacterium]